MAKVTSKLQVTIPKALADECGIQPGDDIEWSLTGSTIRIVRKRPTAPKNVRTRLKLFDAATARQRQRNETSPLRPGASGRGWSREDLYDRAKSR